MIGLEDHGEWEEIGGDDVINAQIPTSLVRLGEKKRSASGKGGTYGVSETSKNAGGLLVHRLCRLDGWKLTREAGYMESGYLWLDVA